MIQPAHTYHIRSTRDLFALHDRERVRDPTLVAIRIHSLVVDEGVDAILYGLQQGKWPFLRSLIINTIVTPTHLLLKALQEGALVNLRVLAFSCSCWSSSDLIDMVCILMHKTTTPHLQRLILLRTSEEDVVSGMKALLAVRPLLKIELRSLV